MGSGLETWYWHGIHASPYLGVSWRWFKFLGQGLFGPVIRYAVSTLSCFNHRVHLIEANVKFRRPEGFSVTNDALNDDRGAVWTARIRDAKQVLNELRCVPCPCAFHGERRSCWP